MAKRRLHDQYFKQAKREGYLARSAFKLLQIQEAKRVLRSGDRVLDLGCAPGAWIQASLEVVGERGSVVGLDLQEIRAEFEQNVRTIQGDVFETDAQTLLPESGELFNAVLSDMAPSTSGHGDDMRSAHLVRRVIELLPNILCPGGNFVAKILEGAEYPEVLREASALFASARGYKPKASRDVSREMYIVGKTFKPG